MWWMIGVGVLVVVAVIVAIVIKKRRDSNLAPVSVVIFRSAFAQLSEAQVRAAHRRAYGVEATIQRIPAPDRDGTNRGGSLFMVISEAMPPMGVIDSAVPYMTKDEAAEVASRQEHPDVRRVMTEHRAWIGVDAMGLHGKVDDETLEKVHRMLGRFAAELLDERSLLLYLPRTGRVARTGGKAESSLTSGALAELFGDDELHAPMFQVKGDDREIERAIATAQKRLPEFLGAFERLGAAAEPLFKAHFEEAAENIWLQLESVEREGLCGRIANNPIHNSIPKKGELATVKLENVIDWAYVGEKGEPTGLFVDSILMKRGR